jgi:tripartite-type tricarboxylate transporter receptor subunit TctC
VLEFLFAQLKINRSVAVPPGTPAERVALLRKAFDAVTKDPSFLSEAKRQRIDINTLDGAETAAAVESFYNSPKDMIEIVRTALGAEPRR